MNRALLLVILMLSTNLFAASETQIKAVFLEKFTHLIKWPENRQEHFVICVLNDDDFADTLEQLYLNKTFKEKPVDIIRLSTNKDIPFCQLLFIGKETKNVSKILKNSATSPLLTVSDHKGFIDDNIMITIFVSKKRFKYIINNHAAKNANIKISYLLLKSAQRVIQ